MGSGKKTVGIMDLLRYPCLYKLDPCSYDPIAEASNWNPINLNTRRCNYET